MSERPGGTGVEQSMETCCQRLFRRCREQLPGAVISAILGTALGAALGYDSGHASGMEQGTKEILELVPESLRDQLERLPAAIDELADEQAQSLLQERQTRLEECILERATEWYTSEARKLAGEARRLAANPDAHAQQALESRARSMVHYVRTFRERLSEVSTEGLNHWSTKLEKLLTAKAEPKVINDAMDQLEKGLKVNKLLKSLPSPPSP